MLPAYAGMIPKRNKTMACLHGAPRVCGDDPMDEYQDWALAACSPRMRGGSLACLDADIPAKVLPAYAGMIPKRNKTMAFLHGAPRVCGDDPMDEYKDWAIAACSPRMRG